MVKNEEQAMLKTLRSLIDAGITQYFIYDTGSTDNTIAITQEVFKKNNIKNYIIEQEPWIDFSASRNHALRRTEYGFPCATFILMLDAEWILHNGKQLIKYCQEQKNQKKSLYAIHLKGKQIQLVLPRLIRSKRNIHFVGKVHEQPNIQYQATVPSDIYFELNPSKGGIEKSRNRWLKDRDILLEEVNNRPSDINAVQFLAQTYLSLQDYPNAVLWYEKLQKLLVNTNTDLFLSLFYLSFAYEANNQIDKAIACYLQTFKARPARAEPLIRLALIFYNQKDYAQAYTYAKQTVAIPYPEKEIDIIEKELYDFTRYEILALTAGIMQDYQAGYQATLQALKQKPDAQHLQKFKQAYEAELQKLKV